MDVNYADKIKSAIFEDRSFTPDGQSEAIDYIVLALTVDIDGEERTFDFKSKSMADKATFFRLADAVK